MPFTAGEPNENNYRNNNIRPHDGRISGFILVSSVFVIVLLSMLGVEFVDHKSDKNSKYIPIYSYLCIVIFLAIIVCVGTLFIYRRRQTQITERVKPTTNVKYIFLWIFTIGSIFFSLAKITSAVQCKKHIFEEFQRIGCIDKNITYDPSYEKSYVSLQSIQIIFCLVQSFFVQTFISLRFKSSWKMYYSLLLIVLANISQWAHYFSEIYIYEGGRPMASCNKANYTICESDELLRTIQPYCAPIKMEYFLLSMICIAELWPSNHIHVDEAILLKSNSGSEYTPLLLSSDLTLTIVEPFGVSDLSY